MKAELLVWAWLCLSVAVIGPATGKKKYSRSGSEPEPMPRTPTYSDAYMGTLRCLKLHEGSTTYFFHVNGVCALFSCRVKEFYGDKKVRVKPYGCKCRSKNVFESDLVWPQCCRKCAVGAVAVEGGRGAPATDGTVAPVEGTSTEANHIAPKPSLEVSPTPSVAGGRFDPTPADQSNLEIIGAGDATEVAPAKEESTTLPTGTTTTTA